MEIGAAFFIYGIGVLWAYKTGRVFRVAESGSPVLPQAGGQSDSNVISNRTLKTLGGGGGTVSH
jgi:hypothetical protein